MTSVRILHCIDSLNNSDGGPARSVPALAAAEGRNGADVRVWSKQPATIDVSEYDSATFISGPVNQAMSGDWSPHVVHDHGLWQLNHHNTANLAQKLKIPRIVSPRGMLEPWCLNHRKFRKQVAWRLYQHRDLKLSQCLHATSESEARQFRTLGFTQPVVLLPNGVTLPTAIQSLELKNTPRSKQREVLFLSRIHPVKGLLNLVAAWKNNVTEGWILRIVGDSEDGHETAVRTAIDDAGLDKSVRIEPAVHSAEKWNYMRRADIVVLPSASENFGIVVAEALAVGTPVITTTGTPWQRLIDYDCGWYVEPSIDGLSEALRSSMSTAAERLGEMGNRGKTWVQDEFSWSDLSMKMLQTYNWLLNQGTAPNAMCLNENNAIHVS